MTRDERWTAIFDGRTLDGFVQQNSPVWKVVDGALIWDPDSKDREAMQTVNVFDDADVRIRFDVLHDLKQIYFVIRQEGDASYATRWDPEQIRDLKGRPHELIFICRGESVSASLDGKSVPITPSGRPRQGRLQFGGSGEGLRIFSIEYR